MKKITMFFAAMLFALVAFAEPTTVTVSASEGSGQPATFTSADFTITTADISGGFFAAPPSISTTDDGTNLHVTANGAMSFKMTNADAKITKVVLNVANEAAGVTLIANVGETVSNMADPSVTVFRGATAYEITPAEATTNLHVVNVGKGSTLIKISSFEVTYEVAGQEEPAGPVEVTTMDELKAHAGEIVIYKGLEPIVEGFMGMNNYFMPDGETMLYCELANTLPARFDAKGIYSAEEGMFAVQEFVAIYAFNTVSDLNMFLLTSNPTDEQKAAAYEIKSSFVVTYVDAMFGKIYAQYEGTSPYGFGTMMYSIEFTLAGPRPRAIGESVDPTQLQPGDEIVVTGIYTEAVYNDETGNLISPEYLALTAVNLVSQNNALEATSVASIYEAKRDYVSGYISIKGGTVAEGVTGYTLTDAYGGVLNVMQASEETDLSAYVGKELDKILVGVLTYNAMLQDYVLCALELRESKEYFDNIAALLAAGPQMDYSISRALRNPVVVNYILYNQWSGYTLFVEDATGVLAVKGVGVLDEDDNYTFPYEVEAGDSILGIDGVLDNGVMWTGADYGINVDLTYVSEGEVNVIEVALADLMADQVAWQEASWNAEAYVSPYANRVVKLTGLTLEETDDDATAYWVQGESKLEFNPKLWAQLEMEVPANVAALTGIADYEGIWNYSFTVIPAAVEVAGETVNVELVEVANVYSENGLIVAEGEFQIFTVTGQNVTDMNGNLEGGVYVVRTANATAKVIVK